MYYMSAETSVSVSLTNTVNWSHPEIKRPGERDSNIPAASMLQGIIQADRYWERWIDSRFGQKILFKAVIKKYLSGQQGH